MFIFYYISVLLNVIDTAPILKENKESITIILSAKRSAIACKWKDSLAPSLAIWHKYNLEPLSDDSTHK